MGKSRGKEGNLQHFLTVVKIGIDSDEIPLMGLDQAGAQYSQLSPEITNQASLIPVEIDLTQFGSKNLYKKIFFGECCKF